MLYAIHDNATNEHVYLRTCPEPCRGADKGARTSAQSALGMESKQLGYLQLADHPGRHEPGTGEVHYNRVLKQAYDLGYRDFVGLECRPKEGEDTAARRVAAADVW